MLFGLIYPLLVTGIAWLLEPDHGGGKQITVKGKVIAFEVIGQSFTSSRYFRGRPSAVDYNAASAGASNWSLSNPLLRSVIRARLDTFRRQNPAAGNTLVPVDLLTASGSGLDPDISPEAAFIQVRRVSETRGIPEAQVVALIRKHTEGPLWGLLGPRHVNVLKLNIDLDQLQSTESGQNKGKAGPG